MNYTNITVLTLCLLTLLFIDSAYAGRTITSVSVEGGASVTVAPDTTDITTTVNVTTSRGFWDPLYENDWGSTRWSVGTLSGCVDHGNGTISNNYNTIFDIQAPSISGSYDLHVVAYYDDNCQFGSSSVYTLTGAIVVDGVVTDPAYAYLFDEESWDGTAGEVLDSGSNIYNATAINGASTEITSPAIPGNPGTCGYGVFDGVDDYVALPSSYPNLTSDFTITAWIRTHDNTRGHQRIFIDDPNNSQGIGFSLSDGGTGKVRFFSRSTNPVYIDTDAVILNDTWYFVAAVADISNQMKTIYVYSQEGTQLAATSSSYSGSWGYDSGDASIGGENNSSFEGSYRFDGNIDEVRVHQGALSQSDIEALQEDTHYCLAPPVAEYRFDLCTETDVIIDDSGNGFDGTVFNGPLEIGAGKVCNAAIFDGIDDYIEIDDQDQFDNTDVLTISGWMNPLSIRDAPPTGNARGVISKRNRPSDEASYGIFFYSARADGKLWIDLDTENNRFASNAVIPEDTWTHFAVVFDGSLPENERAKLYINGVLDRTARESSDKIPGYNSNMYIGNLYYGTDQLKVFKGLLDEINVSRTALSADEVYYLYTSSYRDNCQVCAENNLDHIRIEHQGTGLTCSPSEVTVRACADSFCQDEYTDPVYFTMTPTSGSPGWIGGATRTMVDGSFIIDLRQTSVATVTVGVTNISPVPANNYQCYYAGVPASCDISFYDSGFIFDVPDHISAVEQNVTFAAVRSDVTSEQCIPGFADVSRNIVFGYVYSNPATGSLPIEINGTSINSSGSTVSLAFDGNGESELAVSYTDVGQLNLTASYSGSGANEDDGLVMTGNDSFVARPDHFTLSIPGNPAAADAGGGSFTSAGTSFSVEVSARNASGSVTPNYGQEAVPEGVSISANLVTPAGQHNPALVGSFNSFGTDCDGSSAQGYACGSFSWPEVGIVTLTPEIADDNYLGSGDVVGTVSENVGRFIPAYFSVAESSNPEFYDSCNSGGFTYLGQPFSYLIDPQLTVTAMSSGGATLLNYGQSFWKLGSSWSGRSYAHDPVNGDLPVSVAVSGSVSLTGDDNYDGQGVFELNGESIVYGKPTTPQEPFATNIKLSLAADDLTDSDGVCYDSDGGGCDPYVFGTIGDTEQRYGRLVLRNAYGPETIPLVIPAETEYFLNGGYLLNSSDSCTIIDSAYLQISANPNSLGTSPAGSGSFSAGVNQDLMMSAPGAGQSGSVDLIYDLDSSGYSWLKLGSSNPASRASFGLFQGNPHLIYTREAVW